MSLELPALRGDDPLGYLAALGLIRLLDAELSGQARMSFSRSTSCAVLHSPLTTLQEVADQLKGIVMDVDPEGAVPRASSAFPLRPGTRSRSGDQPTGGESDPMRVPREEFPQLVTLTDLLGNEAMDWLPNLVTDLAVDRNGRAALTPYMAPSGKQNVWTFFRKSYEAVRDNPERLTEALTGWRRIDGFTGEYLDHRVLRSAADHPSGKSTEAGVPGATWLATQALPLLRLTGDGITATATLWHRLGRRTIMTWPLWHPPLDIHAVRTLIEHPALRPHSSGRSNHTNTFIVDRPGYAPLGVFNVQGAERQLIPGRKNAGALAPIVILDHNPNTPRR